MGIYLNSKDRILAASSVRYKLMSLMSVAYLLIFPLSSTVLPVVSGAIVTLIILSSIALYLFPQKGMQHFNHEERLFYFSVSSIVIVAVLATAISGMEYQGMKMLGKFIYLLMVIPAYFYFKNIRIKAGWVWYGLVLGAFVSAAVGIFEIATDTYKSGYPGRAKGATHPIIFGDLALLIGVMSLAGLGWFKSQSRRHILLPIVALSCGLLASILSQSRGGWVAIPFLAIILLRYSPLHISRLKILIGVFAFVGAITLAYQVPQTGIIERVDKTIDNINNYFTADEMKAAGGTSVTSRFEMWQASWSIFLDNPLVGVGWGHYQKNAKVLVQKGERNRSAGNWSHPHNQFISAMVNGGVFALIAIIILFYIPARIFYKACKSPEKSDDARSMALAGLLLMVGFAIFNMSESFLERSRTVTFFIFYLAVFMAGIREKSKVISHKS
ncbi:MAG: O-antigen ligase family protein [Woeseiaceae bacterium]